MPVRLACFLNDGESLIDYMRNKWPPIPIYRIETLVYEETRRPTALRHLCQPELSFKKWQ